MADVAALLQDAVQRHQAGRLDEAESAYRRILSLAPRQADALYLLGTLHYQKGSLGSAALFLTKSLEQQPGRAEARNNLGMVLFDQGKLTDAQSQFERAVELRPHYPDAWYNLGNLHRTREDHRRAVDAYRRAIADAPNDARIHDNLSLALRSLGRLEEALESSRRATTLDPQSAVAHNNRGAILKALRRYEEAVESFSLALQLRPGFPEAMGNLGVAEAHLGRLQEAERFCRQAVQQNPQSASAHNNLGLVLHLLDRHEEAAAHFHEAAVLRPGFADALTNLGICFHAMRDFPQAAKAFRMALEHSPESAVAWSNLGSVLEQIGSLDEAAECFEKTQRLSPDNPLWKLRAAALCPLVFNDEREIDQYRRRLEKSLDEAAALHPQIAPAVVLSTDLRPPFNLQFLGRDERPLRERFARVLAGSFPAENPPPGTGEPHVGFFVADGHEWSFIRSIAGLFNHFSPGWRPTIICSPSGRDRIRPTIQNGGVSYLTISPSLEQSLQDVRSARFDLIYHWEIGTHPMNYFLPFCRLAPAQCTSWGIQVTSGIPAVDAYISSDWIETTQADAHYTERLVRLRTMLTYQRRNAPPAQQPNRESFGLDPKRHLYLCAQHLGKFQPDFDPILAEVLRRDPLADVVVTEGRTPEAVPLLQSRMQRTIGDDARRVVFLPNQGGDRYFQLVLSADVVLDPLHFGGVNTTYDAFSYDQPIVTLPSQYHRGRYTLGCYRWMGLEDYVASSPAQYVEIAVRLGADRGEKLAAAARIRQAAPILFENAAAAGELEECLLEMVERSRSTLA